MEAKSILNELKRLQSDTKILELFGQVPKVEGKSWFKFVRYNENIHAEIYINNQKIKLFDTYESVYNKINEWIKKIKRL